MEQTAQLLLELIDGLRSEASATEHSFEEEIRQMEINLRLEKGEGIVLPENYPRS